MQVISPSLLALWWSAWEQLRQQTKYNKILQASSSNKPETSEAKVSIARDCTVTARAEVTRDPWEILALWTVPVIIKNGHKTMKVNSLLDEAISVVMLHSSCSLKVNLRSYRTNTERLWREIEDLMHGVHNLQRRWKADKHHVSFHNIQSNRKPSSCWLECVVIQDGNIYRI